MPRLTSSNSLALRNPVNALITVVVLLSGIRTSGQAIGPQLIMDSVNVRQEGVVSFSSLPLGRELTSGVALPQSLLGETEDQSFRLFIDVDSIQQVRFNAFTFTAHLVHAQGSQPEVYKYQMTGNPAGSFHDSPVRVLFHVRSGESNLPGSILMPVYNATAGNLLGIEKQKDLAYVSVSGTTPIRLALNNFADTLPIVVTDVEVSPGCARCWTHIESPVNSRNPLLVDPGSSVELPLSLSPSTIPALMQGALAIKSDVPHETLALTLTYHTVPGGSDRRQTVFTMVRFGPGLLGLGLALCGGIALGLAARYLLTGRVGNENERALHAILLALVLGMIAEFVGIMLTAYGNSRLIVFGLDIDPRQLFPAFVLALLVSGGAAVTNWAKDLFGKKA